MLKLQLINTLKRLCIFPSVFDYIPGSQTTSTPSPKQNETGFQYCNSDLRWFYCSGHNPRVLCGNLQSLPFLGVLSKADPEVPVPPLIYPKAILFAVTCHVTVSLSASLCNVGCKDRMPSLGPLKPKFQIQLPLRDLLKAHEGVISKNCPTISKVIISLLPMHLCHSTLIFKILIHNSLRQSISVAYFIPGGIFCLGHIQSHLSICLQQFVGKCQYHLFSLYLSIYLQVWVRG